MKTMMKRTSVLRAATLPILAAWGVAAIAAEGYTGIHPAMNSGLYLWGARSSAIPTTR